MEENNLKNSSVDVRCLTLERWNFPQTTPLFGAEEESSVAGEDYISYSSHHFIHIEEGKSELEQPIQRVYLTMESLRKEQRRTRVSDVHMAQNMTLLGRKNDFWHAPGDVLYISFLQLTNSIVPNIDTLQEKIKPIIERYASNASWALYYSLDFCDLVLFTKNVTYDQCNRIMWDIAVVREAELDILRDSFTICGFRKEFLKTAFQKLDQGQCLQWKEQAFLSIQLSIQSYKVWESFENILKTQNIFYKTTYTFGRYDIRLVTENLSGDQILRFLYWLDKMAENSKDNVFGGYKISIETSSEHAISQEPKDPKQDRELEVEASQAMDLLCSQCGEAWPDSADYVDETQRSLKALLKNGFSEEFVISVLSTFLAFLEITIALEAYRKEKRLESDEKHRLKESQEKMTRHYFNALNILAFCTMHGERQFIQAPAFNAMYFDVPPKLLAFYSAVAREILEVLISETDAEYYFLFVPNYQKDINVRPLELEMRQNLPYHLAVAHLHESYFYNPILTIKLFCHEAAHYLSDRKRQERARYIFRATSFVLLGNTPMTSIAYEEHGTDFLNLMAEVLADFLLEKLDNTYLHFTRNIQYHLEDISKFLLDSNYGAGVFRSPFDRNEICARWSKVLRNNVTNCPDIFKPLFVKGLDAIQTTLHTMCLTSIFEKDPNGSYVYDAFSEIVAQYVITFDPKLLKNQYANLCENMIQAFSEAYADLRMIELIGDKFSIHDYTDMFLQVDVDNNYQKILRHDAVLSVVKPDGVWKKQVPEDDVFLLYILKQIRQYLSLCHKSPAESPELVRILEILKEGDISEQFKCIRGTIWNYRGKLIEDCKRIQKEYRDQVS